MTTNPWIQHVDLVKRVFLECWNQFHEWKHAQSATELATLGRPSAPVKIEGVTSNAEALLAVHTSYQSEEDLDDFDYGSDVDEELAELRIWQFNVDTSIPPAGEVRPTILTGPVIKHKDEDDIQPVPPYEACVPITQSNNLEDTPAENYCLNFLPFADEPDFATENPSYLYLPEEKTYYTFDYAAGERQLLDFAWQDTDRNPDGTVT
ncbi:hypothetical protein FRB96_008001 [Tulasnella sp. 330]|nr:hypothetical protein FRB96_008001 [Tulasnella sp. 330]KAG8881290.1 hypothetical protein FRB97_009703 [Tulasnella sp. 331]